MDKLWKNIFIDVVILILVITIIVVSTCNATAMKHTRNCIVIGRLTAEQLMLPVTGLYLVSVKLFPIINSCYSMHWSVVVSTPKGYFNISTSKYMAIYIHQVTTYDKFKFVSDRWENDLYVLKQYQLREEFKEKPPTVYGVACAAMDYYNKDNRMKYNPFNHNCQHTAQFIIESFGEYSADDPMLCTVRGSSMIKKLINDTFTGPKIMI